MGNEAKQLPSIKFIDFDYVLGPYFKIGSKERIITIIEGITGHYYPFYQSTGDSSKWGGNWFPFGGTTIIEDIQTRDTGSIFEESGFIKPTSIGGSEMLENELDAALYQQLPYDGHENGRFGNTETLTLSACLGGGFWSSKKGEKLGQKIKAKPQYVQNLVISEPEETIKWDHKGNWSTAINHWLSKHSNNEYIGRNYDKWLCHHFNIVRVAGKLPETFPKGDFIRFPQSPRPGSRIRSSSGGDKDDDDAATTDASVRSVGLDSVDSVLSAHSASKNISKKQKIVSSINRHKLLSFITLILVTVGVIIGIAFLVALAVMALSNPVTLFGLSATLTTLTIGGAVGLVAGIAIAAIVVGITYKNMRHESQERAENFRSESVGGNRDNQSSGSNVGNDERTRKQDGPLRSPSRIGSSLYGGDERVSNGDELHHQSDMGTSINGICCQ